MWAARGSPGSGGQWLAEGGGAGPDGGAPLRDGARRRGARLAPAEELLGLGHRHREHLADVAATEPVLQHAGLETLAFALLAHRLYADHEREVGVDDAGAVAGGAGALRVGAEHR